ncbi:MAG: DNA primase [Nitrospinae bacterium]|nr:DNA primase [Nitrospinota bacterium]
MAELFPPDLIERVRDSVDIVELISSYVTLKRSGANYMGLCPFHSEKSPSFSVSPAKQFYHCFGCGEGGNAISFIMKREGLSFPQAVEQLAGRAGITLPKRSEESQEHSKILEINKLAAEFYKSQFKKNSPAWKYAEERGLSPETLEKFRIGYAPDAWDACLKHLLTKKITEAEVEKAGLAKKSSAGNLIDRFRDRLMFPILDERDRVVAFGGRSLIKDDNGPKYLNSPETQVYVKGRVLYGLNRASQSIRKKDQALIVEGYMDLIALHQAGVENAVASSGTAFTEWQCRLLRRHTPNLVMVFDGDEAGKKAAQRATDVAATLGLRPAVVMLPAGKDPDDVIKGGGAEAFLEIVKEAKPYMTYLIEQACLKHDMTTGEGRADAARSMLPELSRVRDPLELASCINFLAQKTGIPAEKIEARLKGKPPEARPQVGARTPAPLNATLNKPRPIKPASQHEKIVMRGFLDHPSELNGKWKDVTADDFETPGFGVMADHIRKCLAENTASASDMIDRLEDAELGKSMRALAMDDGRRPPAGQLDAYVDDLHKAGEARRKEAERRREIALKKSEADNLKS